MASLFPGVHSEILERYLVSGLLPQYFQAYSCQACRLVNVSLDDVGVKVTFYLVLLGLGKSECDDCVGVGRQNQTKQKVYTGINEGVYIPFYAVDHRDLDLLLRLLTNILKCFYFRIYESWNLRFRDSISPIDDRRWHKTLIFLLPPFEKFLHHWLEAFHEFLCGVLRCRNRTVLATLGVVGRNQRRI